MRRPWPSRLPRRGVWVIRRRVAWYFWTDRHAWRPVTRYVYLAVGVAPPADWEKRVAARKGGVMHKPEPRKGLNSTAPHYNDPSFQLAYPKVYEVMSAATWADGSKKGPGTLFLRVVAQQLEGYLKVPSAALLLRLTAPSLDELLAAFEALLSSGEAPWEQDEYAQPKARRKKATEN